MALKFTLKTEKIEFSDSDYIEVRGLALPDIIQLVEAHKAPISELFDKFTGRSADSFTLEDAGDLAANLVTVAPGIASHIIALAADATSQYDQITMLPIDVQVAALEKIAGLTFAMSGGLKNFAETVLRISKGVTGLKDELKAPLLT